MTTRRHLLGLLGSLPLTALAARQARADSADVFAADGIAIHGADPVAYFTQGRAVPGSRAQALMWRGAYWHFSTAASRARFEMNPTAYAPQFGGYCAYALAQGALASTVPEAFTIHDGRLYLNYSLAVRDLWWQDIPGHLARAEPYWPGILAG